MQSIKNKVIIACAGSGKTTLLVRTALTRSDCRIAIITYTNSNMREILRRFGELNSGVPQHVDVDTWFSFLLRNGARPYQRSVYAEHRIESLAFVNERSTKGASEEDTRRYYFARGEAIYSDKTAQFVLKCEAASGGRVTGRLRQLYSDLFIDEFQDLAGWDLDLIRMLLESGVRVTLVGDPRQHIYSTNPSSKNKQYIGIKVVGLVREWEKKGLCQLDNQSGTYRCNQSVCTFANGLWAGIDKMTPLTDMKTEHDGVFLVSERQVHQYIRRFRPQVLRYNKKAKTYGYAALNFGLAKGLEFERVLIIPTEPIRKYLTSGDLSHIEKSRDRLHVAVTRAKHSVAFVFDGPSPIVPSQWQDSSE
jgi:DNA helicase II / ATP-dependent DNA helicase PcrA